MKVEIDSPAEVANYLKKVYGSLRVYSEELAEYDRHVRSLSIASEMIDEQLAVTQREIMVCLESLKRYSENEESSREAENQQRMCLERLERTRYRRNQLQQIKEETVQLAYEAKKMKDNAEALADRWKNPTIKLTQMIEQYLRAL